MAASGGTQQFLLAREGTFGTQSVGQYKTFRATRGAVRRSVRSVESQLIRGDRQGGGTFPTFFASEGSLQTEIVCADPAHNELIARALYSSFVNADLTDANGATKGASKASTVDTIAAAGSNTFNFTAADFITDDLQPGAWIGIRNLSAAADGWWKVATVADLNTITVEANGIGFDGVAKAHPGVVAGSGDETYTYAFARNFTQKIGLTVERGFTDVSQFLRMIGGVPATFGMNLQSGQLASMNFSLLGTGYASAATSADATPDAPATTQPVSASTNVARIFKAGVTLAACRRLEYAIDNRVTQLEQIGQSIAADVIAGTYAITGTIEAYFFDRTVLDDLLGTQAPFSMESVFVDPAGNLLAVNLPAVNLTGGGVDESGSDDPVVASYPFGARLGSGQSYIIQVDSIAKPA